MIRELPRRFHLVRTEDVSGTSGTGIVAEGVQFSNGYCALTWLTPYTSVAVYHSTFVIEQIHGHGGRTQIVFDDPPHEIAEDVAPPLHLPEA